MTQPVHCPLNNDQVRIAMSFIDRVALMPDHRMKTQRQRYLDMMELVAAVAADPLLAKDYGGVDNLFPIWSYFFDRHVQAKKEGN